MFLIQNLLLFVNPFIFMGVPCLFPARNLVWLTVSPYEALASGEGACQGDAGGNRKVMAVYRAKGFWMGCQGSVFCGTQTVYLTNPMLWPMSETMENPQKPLSFHAYGNVV